MANAGLRLEVNDCLSQSRSFKWEDIPQGAWDSNTKDFAMLEISFT